MFAKPIVAVLAALSASVGAAPAPSGQSAPLGLANDACAGAPTISEPVRAFFRARMDPAAPPPPASSSGDVAAYQAASDRQKAQDWAQLCHYAADNERLALLPPSARKIVYMGDSLTELWAIADPAFFSNGRVNRGISGQTTGQMLVRFQADVIALHPHVVHIWAGANDLAGNTGPERLADIQNNIIAMVTLARANHIGVVLASLPPIAAFPWRPELRPAAQVKLFNAWLRQYAADAGARYVDYYAPLLGTGAATERTLTFDGIHLNVAGYAKIRSLGERAAR